MSGEQPYLLALHNRSSPSEAEWTAFWSLIQDHYAQPGAADFIGIVVTEGGGPNARQRKLVSALAKDRLAKGSVISDNPLIRGVVTAFQWLSISQMKSFSPAHAGAAFDYATLTGSERERALRDFTELGEKIEGGNPMQAVNRAIAARV